MVLWFFGFLVFGVEKPKTETPNVTGISIEEIK
jgi:hypothetical protein